MIVQRRHVLAAAAATMGSMAAGPAAGQARRPLAVLANRFSATEYFTALMRRAAGGSLELRMVSVSQLREQTNIALGGGGAAPFDIVHVNAISRVAELAERGWLAPLDDFIAANQHALAPNDISAAMWRAVQRNGETFAIPFALNLQVLFFRRDVLAEMGAEPPRSIGDWLDLAETLRGRVRIPLALTLRGSGLVNEFNNALIAHGGAWLDADGRLAFNSEAGLHALDTLQRLAAAGPRAMVNFTNDDVMVALQQGLAATSNIWITRGVEMDDPEMSRVRGLIAYAGSPVGAGRLPYSGLGVDCWAIPRNARDPQSAFQLMLAATTPQAMRGSAQFCLSPRTSVATDAGLARRYPWNAAAAQNLAAGTGTEPAVSYFPAVRDAVQPHLHRYLRGGVDARLTLDAMERASVTLVRERGVRL